MTQHFTWWPHSVTWTQGAGPRAARFIILRCWVFFSSAACDCICVCEGSPRFPPSHWQVCVCGLVWVYIYTLFSLCVCVCDERTGAASQTKTSLTVEKGQSRSAFKLWPFFFLSLHASDVIKEPEDSSSLLFLQLRPEETSAPSAATRCHPQVNQTHFPTCVPPRVSAPSAPSAAGTW